PFRPASAVVTDMRGNFNFNNDSLWWRGVRAAMPNSRVSGDGSYALSSGDIVLTLRGAPAALPDLRWLYPRLPSQGGGSVDVAFADAATGTSQVAAVGEVGFGAGTVRANNLRLRLHPVQVELAKALASGLQIPVSGVVTGTATVTGDTRTRLAGNLDIAHDDR